jgi:hypothetical protein
LPKAAVSSATAAAAWRCRFSGVTACVNAMEWSRAMRSGAWRQLRACPGPLKSGHAARLTGLLVTGSGRSGDLADLERAGRNGCRRHGPRREPYYGVRCMVIQPTHVRARSLSLEDAPSGPARL